MEKDKMTANNHGPFHTFANKAIGQEKFCFSLFLNMESSKGIEPRMQYLCWVTTAGEPGAGRQLRADRPAQR
jgi:hypothetical protein